MPSTLPRPTTAASGPRPGFTAFQGLQPLASPAIGLNWPSGPPSARDRVAPTTLRTTLPRQNKPDPVAVSCPVLVPVWAHLCMRLVAVPLQGTRPPSSEDTAVGVQGKPSVHPGKGSCGHSVGSLRSPAPGQEGSGLHPGLLCGLWARSHDMGKRVCSQGLRVAWQRAVFRAGGWAQEMESPGRLPAPHPQGSLGKGWVAQGPSGACPAPE